MKILIVAKTRRGSGACVGGITEHGESVRLIAKDAATNQHAGMEYEVGEVWEIEYVPDANILPPHIENVIVLHAERLRHCSNPEKAIYRFMPPVSGGPEKLFDGLTQATAAGGLYVADRTGLPHRSTMFWMPDKPLTMDCESKRIRYRYHTSDGGRTLTFVSFQEPLPEIPAGTLLRVSLSHRWRPEDYPDEELRCFVQLSGWFLSGHRAPKRTTPPSAKTQNAPQASLTPAPLNLDQRAREILKQVFGFSDFLPVQADVIARVLRRQDALVVMPTGGGKSLCYQHPALIFDGLTVVLSPLIALMQDQVSQLGELDIPAAFLNCTLSLHEYIATANRVRNGDLKLLYVAPETLLRPETLVLLEQSKLACLAVDEAHCISDWGHDFRPEYRHIQEVRRRFPQAVCLALTATATRRVREDIRRLLQIPAEGEFVASFNRRNLFLAAEPRSDGLVQTLAFLEKHQGQSGIIYCNTRKQTDELCAALNANGWPAIPYHAGLDDKVRCRNQDQFIHDDAGLMVATVAFGMGINKSNIRFIVHYQLPKDMESYYQEIGRAGRDGLPADCLLLYSRADALIHRHFIEQGAASEQPGRHNRLNALLAYAETPDCRRTLLLNYFGERLTQPCSYCDNCVQSQAHGETLDVTAAAEKILSCVSQTRERFGPAHIIAVLRGSKSGRVTSRRHDRLPVYGAGLEHSVEKWRELEHQFIHLGLLNQDLEFGSLRLTSKGRDVLRARQRVLVPAQRLAAPAKPTLPRFDPKLFQRLRELRNDLAGQVCVPAYVIFSDQALMEMATILPQNKAQLLSVNGVGEIKLARYGDLILQAIRDYCQANSSTQSAVSAPTKPIIRPEPKRRFQEIGELFAAGQTVEKIQRRYGTTRETVIQNLRLFHESGGQLDPHRLLATSRLLAPDRFRVLVAFKRLGVERLAPVHEALDGNISYEELHLLRLYFMCSSNATLSKTSETS